MKKVLSCLMLSLLLTGCGNILPSTDSVSDSSISSSDSIYEIEIDKEDVVSKCSIAGMLIDIAIGRWLCVDLSYEATFRFTDITNQTARIENSNPENIKIEVDSNNKLTFTALKAGDTMLKIYDVDGVLRYRNVIKARNKVSVDEIKDFLINTDHFQASGIGGEAKLTFLSSTEGTFTGYDSGQNLGTVPFTYEFKGDSETTNDEYEFSILEFENSVNDLNCICFYVDFTGCMLHLMTTNTVVDVFFPVN